MAERRGGVQRERRVIGLYVIERGEIIFAGAPGEVRRDPAVAKVVDGGA